MLSIVSIKLNKHTGYRTNIYKQRPATAQIYKKQGPGFAFLLNLPVSAAIN